MNLLEKILSLIFIQKFSKNDFQSFHPAPFHREQWIFSLWDYRHKKVRELIRYLKNHNDTMLKKEIASLMAEHIMGYLGDQQSLSYFREALCIPVPVSKKRLRGRGFNQTEALAKQLAQKIGGTHNNTIVQKNIHNKKQALIQNRRERFENVVGVFSINEKKKHLIENKDIIIVDDLTTTGATLMEMKKVLKKNGARKVIAVTIAH